LIIAAACHCFLKLHSTYREIISHPGRSTEATQEAELVTENNKDIIIIIILTSACHEEYILLQKKKGDHPTSTSP
jgi:hypothetical protein